MDDGSKQQGENALGRAASAYLRSARRQPVAWREWGPEAFAKAAAENKPVLLDVGAVWCHWCHVMDRESYEHAETAALINELYVPVKVDRDERPDVDTRYQAAVAAISGQGGWPLTAFLTPEGKPYFGGTYFPPEERFGRPSFQRVLATMADVFANKREEVEETAGSVLAAIEHNENFDGRGGEPNEALLEKLVASALAQFDEKEGGFGSQPKFPHAGALDLLLDAAGRTSRFARLNDAVRERGTRHPDALQVATMTLDKMAAGGMYDQLAGGFHRYSVDERWRVPHFEKMAYDNSELLKCYVHAFQLTGAEPYAHMAKDIVRWMDDILSDRERGGFYASQDADDSHDDDGDYFTWTLGEAEAVLSAEELAVAALFYGLRAVGDMHHNPAKNVLHRAMSVEAIAATLKKDMGEVLSLTASAKAKLHAARLERKTPFVDTTVYTGWNGMCIAAYLAAGRVLGMPEVMAFGLKSLDRVLEQAWDGDGLAHVVAYAEHAGGTDLAGMLEDYAFVANAALDAWEATGKPHYFAVARALGDAMVSKFYDAEGGGFFDAEGDTAAIGALKVRRKPLQDTPTPSGNAVAVTVLLRLHALTDEAAYEVRARETLEMFAGVVEHFGLYAASYGLALRRAVSGSEQVCVLGEDALAEDLAAAAMHGYAANRSVVVLRQEQMADLPPALAETLPKVPGVGEGSVAVVCRGMSCLPPMRTVEALMSALGRI